jgi:hypothetical protein
MQLSNVGQAITNSLSTPVKLQHNLSSSRASQAHIDAAIG